MRVLYLLTSLLVIAAGCGSSDTESPQSLAPAVNEPAAAAPSPAPPAPPGPSPGGAAGPASQDTAAESPPDMPQPQSLFEAMGLSNSTRPLPPGLTIGGDCSAASGEVEAEIATQAAATIPLKVGLTLVNLWNPTPEEEYECIQQVTAIHRDAIDTTVRCNHRENQGAVLRRLCRSDLAAARMVHTGVGLVTVIGESGDELPETIVGATEFSLSRSEFRELKAAGQTSHHYVQIDRGSGRLELEARGVLRVEGTGVAKILVNGSPVELPVVRASGDSELVGFGKVGRGRVHAVVVDDESFPMFVDYSHTREGNPLPNFRLHFAKVTYPGADPESELARRGKLIVHGIYFDFNSDRIRKESDPILKELGELLARHPDWTLSIDGHTDNVGGDAYNLRLSQRRAASVVRWLVERHGIAAGRLRSAGFGASSPIEPNDTPEGRARNRRVELVRVEDAPAEPARQ